MNSSNLVQTKNSPILHFHHNSNTTLQIIFPTSILGQGEPIHTLVPCGMVVDLPTKNQCMGLFHPNPLFLTTTLASKHPKCPTSMKLTSGSPWTFEDSIDQKKTCFALANLRWSTYKSRTSHDLFMVIKSACLLIYELNA